MSIKPVMKKPSLFRRIIMSLVSGWRRVMDVRYNALNPFLKANLLHVSVIYFLERVLWIYSSKLPRPIWI